MTLNAFDSWHFYTNLKKKNVAISAIEAENKFFFQKITAALFFNIKSWNLLDV